MSNSNIKLTDEAKIQIAKLLGFDISPDKMDDYHQILDDAIRKTALLNINNVKNLVPTGLENPVGDPLIETQIQTQKNEVTKNIQPNDLVTYHGRNVIDDLFDIVEDLPTRNNVNQIKTTLIDDNAITDPQLRGDIRNQKNQILRNLSETDALQYLNSGPRQYNALFDDLQTDGAVANVLRSVINSKLDDFIEPTKTNLLTKNLEIPEFINRYGADLFQNILIKELPNTDTGSIDFFIDYVTQVQIGRASFLGNLMVNNTPGVDSITNNQIELTNKGKDAKKYLKYTTKDVGKDIDLDKIRQVPDTSGSDEYPVDGYFVIGEQGNFNYSEQINKFSSVERNQVDIQNDIQLPNQRTLDGYLINLGEPTNSAGESLTPFIGQTQFTKNDLTVGFTANGGFETQSTYNIISDLSSDLLPTSVENDSELGKSGYIFLKQTIQNRLDRSTTKELEGRFGNVSDAINDPLGAGVALLKGQTSPLTLSYDITTLPGFLKIFDLTRRLSGVDLGISPIPQDSEKTTLKGIWNSLKGLFGSSTQNQVDVCDTNIKRPKPGHIPTNYTLLKYTSQGQLSAMYNNLGFNKFTPEWVNDTRSQGLFDSIIGGVVEFFGGDINKFTNFYIDGRSSGIDPARATSRYDIDDPTLGNISLEYNIIDPTGLITTTVKRTTISDFGKLSDDFREIINSGGDGSRLDTIGILPGTHRDIYWESTPTIARTDNKLNENPRELGFDLDSKTKVSWDSEFNGDSILCNTQSLANRTDLIGQVVRNSTRTYGGVSKGNAVSAWDNTTFKKIDKYCRVWTKDRGYSQVNDLVRKGYTRGARGLMSNVKYTTLDRNGIPIIAPYKNDPELNEVTSKRFMLSIENLAWRGAKVFLPCGEVGPNGGRIMWFPPYGINFSDNGSANWTTNEFMGRTEPIYTYNNATRSGTLDFDLVVDHPSIVNHFNSDIYNPQGYGLADGELESFFADCINYPIEDLLQKYKDFNTADITALTLQINSNKKSLDLIFSGSPRIYFDNDLPGSCTEKPIRDGLGPENKGCDANTFWGVGITDTQTKNYYSDRVGDYRVNNLGNDTNLIAVNDYFGENGVIKKGYDDINNLITLINDKIIEYSSKNIIVATVKMSIESNTSLLNKNKTSYNDNLSIRRFNTLKNYIVTKITEANTGKNITVQITNTKEKDAATSNTVDTPQINKEDQNYLNPDNESVSVYSPGAFKFRYAAIKPETIKLVLIGGEEIPLADGISQNTDTLDNQVTYLNELKKRLNAGVIQPFNKECDMFEGLKSNSPFLYDKLIEKLRYFHPAFHSTTPEGFNSRLTFLQQCLKPGDSIDTSVVTNTVFGPPPICILRIGDFYHTKIVINSINISYTPVWDMNYEGIGMQPMTAKVSMSFNYIGGSSLGGPINELQNALSFNYYANTSVYDSRAKLSKEEQDVVEFANNPILKKSDVVELESKSLSPLTVSPLNGGDLTPPKNPESIPKRNDSKSKTPEVPTFIGDNQDEQNPVDLETR
jgi:hypothetical protein